jgi:predicted lipase
VSSLLDIFINLSIKTIHYCELGHSLGGGIALLAYLYFKTQISQFKEMTNIFVYSFGAPLILGSVPGRGKTPFLCELHSSS